MATRALLLLAAVAGAHLAQACSHVYFEGAHRSLLAEENKPADAPHWTYNLGGADWPGTCANGTKQSPISILTSTVNGDVPQVARADLQFGTAKGLKIINTGHGIQIEWDSLEGTNASVPVRGEEWGAFFDGTDSLEGADDIRSVPVKPLQAHWHSTSEHVLDGDMSPLELHIVTAVNNEKGAWVPEKCKTEKCLAVFGVLVNFAADPMAEAEGFYADVVKSLPAGVGKENAVATELELDLNSLLPADTSYVTYSGSLTTPPCSEGVRWHVFVSPKEVVSASQLESFQHAIAMVKVEGRESGARVTNRDLQPLNGRAVLFREETA